MLSRPAEFFSGGADKFIKPSHRCHAVAMRRRNTGPMKLLNAMHRLDLHLLTRIFSQGERRTVRSLARALSRSGDGYLQVLVPMLLWLLSAPYAEGFATALAVALAAERTLYWTLKNSLRRPRPQVAVPGFRSLITASDQFSFPSGHTSAAFLLATMLTLFYGGPFAVVFAWACGVAMSRVLLGVHFPGDTLAGAIMGSGSALLTAQFLGLA